MGSVVSGYKRTKEQRKIRRQLRQNILSVQKHNTEIFLAKIPKASPMVVMKELGKELRSMSDPDEQLNSHGQLESFVEGRRIPKASPMVIMKEMSQELRSLSVPDVEASIYGQRLCNELFVAGELPPAFSMIWWLWKTSFPTSEVEVKGQLMYIYPSGCGPLVKDKIQQTLPRKRSFCYGRTW